MSTSQTRKDRTIRVPSRERGELEAQLRSREISPRARVRARVLLLSDEGWGREAIATATGSSTSTVGRVRRKYCEQGLKPALRELPRPGGTLKLDQAQKQRVVALACTDPPKGFARWSVRLLTREAIARGLVPPMSREPIRLVLLEHGIKPWREKNVVHSSSRRPVR